MSIEEDDDRPPRNYWDLLPILLAVLLTAAAIGLCFFTFRVGDETPTAQTPAPANGEVTVGIGTGEGSTIHGTPQPRP
jgi:hypothetical protein